jgi:hypothetical protein
MTVPTPDKPLRSRNGEFRPRISSTFKELARVMVSEGLSVDAAAEKLGASVRASRRAFKRPHNRAYYNGLVREVRENAAQLAYLRNLHLSERAESERLRFDASRWVAGVDGIAPVQRIHGVHDVHHTFAGFDYPTLDVTPEDPD